MNTAAQEYKIGQELYRGNQKIKWLVVRIVERDTSLVINDEGKEFITTESYVMLKSELGDIDFVVLLHEDVSAPVDPARKIPSLPSLWRKHGKQADTKTDRS